MSGSIPHSIEAQRFTSERSTQSGAAYTLDTAAETSSNSPTQLRASSDYTVNLSDDAQGLLADEQQSSSEIINAEEETAPSESDKSDKDSENETDTSEDSDDVNAQGLTEEEQQEVDELKDRDEEVRVHEQAHAATGGQYAGSPSYSYEQGPDGKRYATGGEVQIDVSPIPNDPQATIDKMRQVYRAALAPAEPSGADRSVANEAQQNIAQAMSDLSRESRGEETSNNNNSVSLNKSTLESAYEADKSKSSGSNVDLVA